MEKRTKGFLEKRPSLDASSTTRQGLALKTQREL